MSHVKNETLIINVEILHYLASINDLQNYPDKMFIYSI